MFDSKGLARIADEAAKAKRLIGEYSVAGFQNTACADPDL